MTIRALREDEFDRHAELVYVSYAHEREVPARSMLAHPDWWLRGIERDPYYEPAQTRVMEIDGRLVASVTCYHRPSYIAGRQVKAACIGSVCTHPGYRRRGHVREVLAEAIEWMTAEGCEWSFLYGRAEVYGGSGWMNIASWDVTVDLRLREDTGPALNDRTAHPEADVATLAGLHARFNRDLTGPTVRSEQYWHDRVLSPRVAGDAPEFRLLSDADEPVGYYCLEGRAVREIAWVSRPDAVLAHVIRRGGGEQVTFGFCTGQLLALLRDISAIPDQQQCFRQPGGVALTEAYRGLWRLNGGPVSDTLGITDTLSLVRTLREHDYVMWPADRA